jgi:iron complex outermembrane receptor protein
VPQSTKPVWVSAAIAIVGVGLTVCASARAQESSDTPPAAEAEAPQSDSAPAADTGAEPDATSPAPDATAADADTAAPAPEGAPLATIPVEAEPAAEAPTDSAQLEDVIVTATKREKSLREIAGSIGEFDGSRLENEGKFELKDFVEQLPGVTLTTLGPHMVKLNVRGIASDAYFGAPLPSPTGMLIGDTAFNDPFITNIQPDLSAFDLSRVEVLKGPQGTLFGGAALAGAIRYVLQEPVLGEWQARAFSLYEAPDGGSTALSSGAALNAPLFGDALAVRLGYVKREYPGLTDNVREPDNLKEDIDAATGEQLRGILSWRPLDQLGVKLTHLEQDSFSPNAVVIADTADARETRNKILPQPSIAEVGLDSLEAAYDFETMRLTAVGSRTKKHWYVDVDISYVITGPPDEDTDPSTGTFQITDDLSKSVSQELRLQSTDADGLQWLVGAYNADYDIFFEILDDTVANRDAAKQNGTYGTQPYYESSVFYAVGNIEAHEKAGFADLSYKFWDRLELSAGGRYYQTQVTGGFFGTGALARQQNGGQNFDFTGNDISEDGVNPKFSATWEFTPALSVFTLASRGYRFGGVQTVPYESESALPLIPGTSNGVPQYYKSDTIWNYELGARTSWFGNTLHLDATLFYIDYKNPQVVLRTNSPTGLNLAYTDNVDSAVSLGFESMLAWLTPLDGVRLDLSGGYTDSHTTAPFQAPNPYMGGCGCSIVPAGSQMPGVADYQYMAAINYVAPQIWIFDASARVDYTYIGPGVGTLLQDYTINDYGTLNAGLNLSTPVWRLKPRLSFNVSNITDETASKLAYTVKAVPGQLIPVHYLNHPRTFTVRLGLDF